MRNILLAGCAAASLFGAGIAAAQDAKTEAAKMGVELAIGTIKSLTGGGPCTRHIYNKSDHVWKFTGSKGSGMCEDGCGIAPKSSIPISYSTTSMSIDLQGPGYHDGFTVTGRDSCVYLQHSGNTGKAVLNDPANGDIIFID